MFYREYGVTRFFLLIFLVFSCISNSLSNSIPYHSLKNDSNTIYIFPEHLPSAQSDRPVLENHYPEREISQPTHPYSSNRLNPESINSSPLITGRDAGTESPAEATTTPAPVTGAIDYVLMPLIILGTAAPIFVVMYIVMGAIEFKLPPNTQVRSSDDSLSSVSSSWTSSIANTFPYFSPVWNFVVESTSRALEQDQCVENYACQIGSFCRQWGLQNYGVFSYKLLDDIILYFLPSLQQRSFRAFLHSMRTQKDDPDCPSLYSC